MKFGIKSVAAALLAGLVLAGCGQKEENKTLKVGAIAGAIELVGASLESLLVSAGKAGTAFLVRAVPTVLALALLDVAMDWNGLKGAAFTVLGSSALSVIGFWVAIISLQQIHITVDPPGQRKSS